MSACSLAHYAVEQDNAFKLALHDADTDIDILARIVARMSVLGSMPWNASFRQRRQKTLHCQFITMRVDLCVYHHHHHLIHTHCITQYEKQVDYTHNV